MRVASHSCLAHCGVLVPAPFFFHLIPPLLSPHVFLFLCLLCVRPFDFRLVGPAYLEMNEDWMASQNAIGLIASVHLAGLLAAFAGSFITLLYYPPMAKGAGKAESSLTYACLLQGLVIFETIPSMIVYIFALAGANQRTKAISDYCTALLATSADNPLMSNTGLHSSALRSSNISEAGELVQVGARRRSLFVSDGQSLDGANEAMKLAALVERLPCSLTLLGRHITWTDLGVLVAGSCALQFLSFVGLS